MFDILNTQQKRHRIPFAHNRFYQQTLTNKEREQLRPLKNEELKYESHYVEMLKNRAKILQPPTFAIIASNVCNFKNSRY